MFSREAQRSVGLSLGMNAITQEAPATPTTIADRVHLVVASLPRERAAEVLEFAQSMVETDEAEETEDDRRWEELLDKAHTMPKFQAFVEQVERDIAAGLTEPLDLDRM